MCKNCCYNDGEVHAECVVCNKVTREEAISILSRPITMKNVPSDILKAHEMAIKALEQEPCEDTISRQAVISTIYDNKSDFKNDFAQGFFADKIKDLPPVTPQPKTGRWISLIGVQGEIDGQFVKAFTCSECGAISVFRMIDGKIVNGNLCPNCGAKMWEEGE